MITLIIDNSRCQVTGLSMTQQKVLEKILSYEVSPQEAYYSGAFRSKTRCLMNKKGEFPTGLLYLVEAYLKTIDHTVLDNRIRPKTGLNLFTLQLPYDPYPEQIEAVYAAVYNSRGIICAPTGVGKSVIAALIIDKLQVRTLVVVPSLELKKQLTQSLKTAFGFSQVGSMKDKLDIAVENVDSLNEKCIKEYGNYDCVIIDEFHRSGAKTYRKLNDKAWNKVYYKFGMTATPFRSKNTEKLLLESVLSKVVYKIDYKTAVKKKYIVPMEAYTVELPKQKVKSENNWASVYSELVVNNEVRNKIIADLMKEFHKNGISTLCLVKEIKHGENIAKLTGTGFANGIDKDSDLLIKAFNSNKLTSLIGTVGVMGEGIDSRPAEIIILSGLGKSKNAFMQNVGRGFRCYPKKNSCKIILFYDPSHKWTKSHYKEQCKILLDEYNIIPKELKI